VCVACLTTTNCATGLTCVNNQCVQCTTSGECGVSTPYCSARGMCVQCLVDTNCGTGLVCGPTGSCVQCNVNADCSDAGVATCDTTTHTCTSTACAQIRSGNCCADFVLLGDPTAEAACLQAANQNNTTTCQQILIALQRYGYCVR
jgi:hypothetical protein